MDGTQYPGVLVRDASSLAILAALWHALDVQLGDMHFQLDFQPQTTQSFLCSPFAATSQ